MSPLCKESLSGVVVRLRAPSAFAQEAHVMLSLDILRPGVFHTFSPSRACPTFFWMCAEVTLLFYNRVLHAVFASPRHSETFLETPQRRLDFGIPSSFPSGVASIYGSSSFFRIRCHFSGGHLPTSSIISVSVVLLPLYGEQVRP